MKILENKSKLDNLLESIKVKKLNVGLIPTMGSIHKGHLSLVNYSKNIGCFSLATIYIIPTQFDDKDDFINYPKNTQEDIEKLSQSGCDALYIPTSNEVYPTGIKSKKTIFEFRNILCDKFRPSHFDGVSTVVDSLFNIVKPDFAFFGEKDFQQLKIIQSMIKTKDLQIKIQACPSVRLNNGMSYSSRYNNFSLDEKNIFNQVAKKITNSVMSLKKEITLNKIKNLKYDLVTLKIKKIDYIEIRNEKDLKLTIENHNARLFIAFYIGKIRLIDNFILY